MNVSLAAEVVECNFGDQRLSKRLDKMMTKLGEHPTLSFPAALGKEIDQGYEFFAHENVTPEKILSTHRLRTIERILQEKVCLLVHDTSEIELTRPHQQVKGAGPLSADSRLGHYLHPLIAYTPSRLNLGTVWAKMWAREKIDTKRTPKQKSKYLETIPIEEKESFRWLEGQRQAKAVAEICADTQCVLVGDSETDIYEVFSESRQTAHGRPLELLIRGCQNRATDVEAQPILTQARASEVLHRMSIDVSAREAKTKIETRKRSKSRSARTAEVDVRVCQVNLRPPHRPDRKLPIIPIKVVLVEESSPPEGEDAIQWMLLTTLPIDSPEQVLLVIEYYRARWTIENYFKILKSGCRIEERQFEFLPRHFNALAVFMLVAWQVQLFCHLGRECPEMDCDVVLDEAEWKAVYIIATNEKPPKKAPSLNTMIRLIASLGGYVIRKNTEPGYQTLWIGMQRMRDLAAGYKAFGPGSNFNASDT
jgi:hypothetical protein